MTNLGPLPEFRYRGARACHVLHGQGLLHCASVFWEAKEMGLQLPASKAPNYASLERLNYHVLSRARWYMVWMAQKLGLPEPDLPPCPRAAKLWEASRPDGSEYVLALGSAWALCLVDVPAKRFKETYSVPWGAEYSMDSMLEHAVMHLQRHAFQLEEWMHAARESQA